MAWARLLIAAALVLAGGCRPAGAAVDVTYLANEGFLLDDGASQVLIDGLFGAGLEGYEVVPEPWRTKLEAAQEPFDVVDLVLVSHRHPDHFDPRSVARFLQLREGAVLVSSPQVVEEVRRAAGDRAAVEGRVRALGLEPGKRDRLTLGAVTLEAHRVSHGTGPHASIQNLGQLVHLGGMKILHLGDADTGAEELASFRWGEDGIDIAFVPYWYLTSDRQRQLVLEHIPARRIVAMHIPPDEVEALSRTLETELPGAVVFGRPMETRTFGEESPAAGPD